MEQSFINPLISVKVTELEQLVDKLVPVDLFDDYVAKGTYLKAFKVGAIHLAFEGNKIFYRVPILIKVTKDLGVTTVKSSGKILLQFKTVFVINEDWSLKSKTTLEQYGWLQKPEVGLGILSVPITPIVDEALASKKEMLCKVIDDQVRNLKLADHLNRLSSNLPNPVNVNSVGQIWWESSPVETWMHALLVEDKSLQFTCALKSKIRIGVGVPLQMKTPEIKAPNFTSNKRKPSQLNTEVLVAYSFIQKAINENLAGQVFEVDSYKISLKNVSIKNESDKLAIAATLDGTFTGDLLLKGIPFYNEKENLIELKDPEFDLTGKGLKSKAIAGFASKMIFEKIKPFLKYELSKAVDLLNKNLKENEIYPGVKLKLYVVDLKLSQIKLQEDYLELEVGVNALPTVFIDGLILPA